MNHLAMALQLLLMYRQEIRNNRMNFEKELFLTWQKIMTSSEDESKILLKKFITRYIQEIVLPVIFNKFDEWEMQACKDATSDICLIED